jgi:hypothetical protein
MEMTASLKENECITAAVPMRKDAGTVYDSVPLIGTALQDGSCACSTLYEAKRLLYDSQICTQSMRSDLNRDNS